MVRDAGGGVTDRAHSKLRVFTCSHMRLVVWRGEEGWFHVHGHDGSILGRCEASVHRHEVEIGDNAHALVNVVNSHDQRLSRPL
jgi:hypothetical protein